MNCLICLISFYQINSSYILHMVLCNKIPLFFAFCWQQQQCEGMKYIFLSFFI